MPYMRVHSPPLSAELKQRVAHELTERVVRLMSRPGTPGATPEELRSHCTVHITEWQPEDFAIGGVMLGGSQVDYTLEFSDWGLGVRRQRRLARELTEVLAKLFSAQDRLDQINIRFHPYPPKDFSVGGILLADRIPWIARIAKRLGN